jgi:secreted PhoX family phosphatase
MFLKNSAVLGGGLAFSGPFHALGIQAAEGRAPARVPGYGPLVAKGELALPRGFNYQVISRQGDKMRDGSLTPSCFDGMGSFRGRRGTTVLIRNHENRIARNPGGVNNNENPVVVPTGLEYDSDPAYIAGCTKLVVDRRHDGTYDLLDDFAIQGGTDNNCAGGVLPFRSWLTCEEVVRRSAETGKKHGYTFEIDALAEAAEPVVPITGAGRMAHEAAVWRRGILYETEDRRLKPSLDNPPAPTQGGSCFYRYVPDRRIHRPGELAQAGGVLQAAKLRREFHANMDTGRTVGVPYRVEWVTIDNPDHDDDSDGFPIPTPYPTRYQAQAKGAAVFDRMEGMWVEPWGRRRIFFDCTVGGAAQFGQVWEYRADRETLTLVYESKSAATLEGPDNVVVVPSTGDIFLCEDASTPQYIRGLTTNGEIYDFALGLNNGTEFAGACFDPDGRTLYVNQYGNRGALPFGPPGLVTGGPPAGGVTYAIHGPFERRKGGGHDR